MRIYIIEDDISVIGVLENIVEDSGLGTICGDTGDGPPDLPQILSLAPDLVLIDLLMPGKDGIQVVRELREIEKKPSTSELVDWLRALVAGGVAVASRRRSKRQ